ncbi:hypothetical protein [Candidatus Macondimonas diazotrophica]|jgi:hypothetical protein|uniref:Uncharacterized protein n=1 Tax=Candidatus Macondimonas diazotrophica TaxID=2305248 RepID=A0A4Z0F6A4_9GAMM|nr:hypothetical protein [Candidatus Macondimonas diazotrophica]TFZ81700.1 hypothetical protein E4680_11560 [Candidatus Macondimonas diazotrophica]
MNFSELVDEVKSITARPDLQSSAESAVSAATLKAHTSGFYYNDLVELAVQFDEPRRIQTFDPADVSSYYRRVKYIRIWEGDADGEAKEILEPITTEVALDSYGYPRLNVFYMAGKFLQIRTYAELDKILFGFYRYPDITSESFSSWIAVELPWAIIWEAARTIFNRIGYQEQASQMQALVREQYSQLAFQAADVVPS